MRKLVPPLIVLALAGGAFWWSAQKPMSPAGVPYITTDGDYDTTLAKAVGLSTDILIRSDQGKPPTEEEKKQLQRAADLYDVLNEYRPKEGAPLFGAGKIYVLLGRDTVAEALLRQAIMNVEARLQNAPTAQEKDRLTLILADSLAERSKALIALHRPEEALADINRAVELSPENALYLAEKGAALADLDRLPEAAEALHQSLQIAPDHPRARSLMKMVLAAAGQLNPKAP